MKPPFLASFFFSRDALAEAMASGFWKTKSVLLDKMSTSAVIETMNGMPVSLSASLIA